jgi:hypothetical protein
MKQLALVLCALILTGCTSTSGPGTADLRKPESLLGLTREQLSQLLHGGCDHFSGTTAEGLRYCYIEPTQWLLPESNRNVEENAWFRDNKLVEIYFLFHYVDPDNMSRPNLIVPGLEQLYGPANNKTQTCPGEMGSWYINRWTFPKFKIECLSGSWQGSNSRFIGTYKEIRFVDDSIEFPSGPCRPLHSRNLRR